MQTASYQRQFYFLFKNIYIWPYIYIFEKEIEDVDMKLSALNEYITLCIKMIISYNLKLQNNYKHMFIL